MITPDLAETEGLTILTKIVTGLQSQGLTLMELQATDVSLIKKQTEHIHELKEKNSNLEKLLKINNKNFEERHTQEDESYAEILAALDDMDEANFKVKRFTIFNILRSLGICIRCRSFYCECEYDD